MNIKIMKKSLCLLISIMMLIVMLPGCSGSTETEMPDDTTAAEEQIAADQQSSSGQQQDDGTEAIDISSLAGDGVDVDLTKLSSTMVYSVVNDMLVRPNEYLGKKVRMTGAMSYYHDEETDVTYYACLIKDATACCAQGIEFQTTDGYDPSEYPAEGEPVTVSGSYDLYEDNGYQYAVLKEAIIE